MNNRAILIYFKALFFLASTISYCMDPQIFTPINPNNKKHVATVCCAGWQLRWPFCCGDYSIASSCLEKRDLQKDYIDKHYNHSYSLCRLQKVDYRFQQDMVRIYDTKTWIGELIIRPKHIGDLYFDEKISDILMNKSRTLLVGITESHPTIVAVVHCLKRKKRIELKVCDYSAEDIRHYFFGFDKTDDAQLVAFKGCAKFVWDLGPIIESRR